MYIVTKNNPFYPSVEYVTTMAEALVIRDDWLEELAVEDGLHECSVSISEVISTETFRSDY